MSSRISAALKLVGAGAKFQMTRAPSARARRASASDSEKGTSICKTTMSS